MSKPIVVLFGENKILTVCDIGSGGESFDWLESLHIPSQAPGSGGYHLLQNRISERGRGN
jgi:hypothetical protein